MTRLCIQWPRFGPYHLARLEAAHELLSPLGVEVVGLETASDDTLYDWDVEDGPVGFRRVQAMPGATFETVAPAAMERATFDALDRIDPDAVMIMSYGYPDGRAALAWCRRNRRIAVIGTDSKADDGERVAWREALKRRIVSLYDAALVAGEPQRAYLEALGFAPDRIRIGYNVVDNEHFARAAAHARQHPETTHARPGLADGTPFFLFVGRMLTVKNLDGLLEAYSRYRARTDAPWRLLLVGDGPVRAALEADVAARGLDGVVFCGFQQAGAMGAYYGRASALVLPSWKDTWGLVVNEAMAAGLPVAVSRRVGCWRDLVEEGANGYTFMPDDRGALADILTTLSSGEADLGAMGSRSREIVARFPLDRFGRELWAAVEAGRAHADRRPDWIAMAALRALRTVSRSVTAFHSTEV